jgi:hypothetical protein
VTAFDASLSQEDTMIAAAQLPPQDTVTFAIWTFDRIERVKLHPTIPGRTTRTHVPDAAFFEECPSDWTRRQCVERAWHLTAEHGRTFFVRCRDATGAWEPIERDVYRRGIAEVTQAGKRARAARNTAKRRSKSAWRQPTLLTEVPRDGDAG